LWRGRTQQQIPKLRKALTVSGYIMTTLKFITAFLLIALYSCGQNTAKRKVDPKVTALSNKIIPLVSHLDNSDSCKQALLYLDSATTIDNNFFNCYYNKLMFLCSLKQFDKAVQTLNECLRIAPRAGNLYFTGGVLYEKIGDTISSKKYFQKSMTIINSVLDTMKARNLDYEVLLNDKALNLIMLDDYKGGNDMLKAFADRQQERDLKEMALSYMNKSKKEIVDMLTDMQYSR